MLRKGSLLTTPWRYHSKYNSKPDTYTECLKKCKCCMQSSQYTPRPTSNAHSSAELRIAWMLTPKILNTCPIQHVSQRFLSLYTKYRTPNKLCGDFFLCIKECIHFLRHCILPRSCRFFIKPKTGVAACWAPTARFKTQVFKSKGLWKINMYPIRTSWCFNRTIVGNVCVVNCVEVPMFILNTRIAVRIC
jgi:hypothetical protein